jgi:hypothetical protein
MCVLSALKSSNCAVVAITAPPRDFLASISSESDLPQHEVAEDPRVAMALAGKGDNLCRESLFFPSSFIGQVKNSADIIEHRRHRMDVRVPKNTTSQKWNDGHWRRVSSLAHVHPCALRFPLASANFVRMRTEFAIMMAKAYIEAIIDRGSKPAGVGG